MGYEGSDIICPDDFKWAVEVKNDKSVKLKHLFKPTAKLIDFWVQTAKQAAHQSKSPLLVAKIEGMWFCWTSGNIQAWDIFEEWCEIHAE